MNKLLLSAMFVLLLGGCNRKPCQHEWIPVTSRYVRSFGFGDVESVNLKFNAWACIKCNEIRTINPTKQNTGGK